VYGLAVSRSGYGCECMGWLYLFHDMGVSIGWLNLGQERRVREWADCYKVRIGV
jgi:hypothetical protein